MDKAFFYECFPLFYDLLFYIFNLNSKSELKWEKNYEQAMFVLEGSICSPRTSSFSCNKWNKFSFQNGVLYIS